MDKIRAPYGFVPVSDFVHFPDWAGAANQDVPLEGALSGHIDIEIKAETPLFVRGTDDPGRFFRLPDGTLAIPDGTLAIPGSAIRGMLRNTVEIAAFGKLGQVDERRYGVRDLNNRPVYADHMAEVMRAADGGQIPLPKVHAGWLRLDPTADIADRDGPPADPVAAIEACDWAKIEYALLEDIARSRRVHGFNPGRRQSSPDKYLTWGDASREVQVDLEVLRPRSSMPPTELSRVLGPGKRTGTLVFTGQPNEWRGDRQKRRSAGNAKHHDFVFLEGTGQVYAVPRKVYQDFLFVHSDGGQQHNEARSQDPNPEWKHWEVDFLKGERVPVFFLLGEDGSLRAFGLAMMFRLAYAFGVEDAVENAQKDWRSPKPDLAETLFGRVLPNKAERKRDQALRGRVSLGLARAVAGTVQEGDEVTAVLASPKASYYPSYLVQGRRPGEPAPWVPYTTINGRTSQVPGYNTYMDPGAKVRGWKRYRPQDAVSKPPLPTKGDGSPMDLSKVGTTFRPVSPGARFTTRLRVHNVLPVELGALLWALDYGGDPVARHLLGLARSFGYGRVRLSVVGTDIEDLSSPAEARRDRLVTDTTVYVRAFVKHMEEVCSGAGIAGGWRESEHIRELVALARPIPPGSDDGRHMDLRHPVHRNEFQAAKKAGLALPLVSDPGRAVQRVGDSRGGMEAPRVSGRGPDNRGRSPRRDAPAPPPSKRGGWTGLKGGTTVRVKLTGQSKKGKWRAELLDHPAQGVIGFGTPPPDAALGMEFDVIVTSGGNPRDVGMTWPDGTA